MGMDDLPSDISLNIFSRLDVDSVLDCKLVCRTWRNLVKNPSFARSRLACRKLLLQNFDENDTHQDLSSDTCETFQSGFLSLEELGNKSDDCRLHYVEYDVNFKKKFYEIKNKTINIPPIKKTYLTMIGSCNGLICSTVRHHRLNDPIHICNPVTLEYVYLPRYVSGVGTHKMASGFGYSPSTDEYKVVRIYKKSVHTAWCFQVYILGNESRKWTDEKEIPNRFENCFRYSTGILVNGERYWLEQASKIVAFSLADEEFRDVASPPFVERSGYDDKRLCAFGDWLCLLDKEFTVYAETRSLIPLAFTKKGKVLFWQDHRFVSCYDPETAILEKLSKDENNDKADLESYHEAHHINSFVSLKALGVQNCRRRLKYMAK
ncbi:F-box protein At3g07870-like [Papaver somniferum]|uniref:F-box protein At3g07870-like n=1 Tax=Papaver somniferum TaxID=3469 RepID=UPI000E701F63|nr:F-box protein At3g07870-like [Papaver somniferum]